MKIYALGGILLTRPIKSLFPFFLLAILALQSLNAQTPTVEGNALHPVLESCTVGDLKTRQTCTRETINRHLAEELRYPKVAKEAGKSGTVVAQINVDKRGIVREVKIVQSQGWGMDQEAVRVLNELPSFEPTMLEGKPVNSQLTLPVIFSPGQSIAFEELKVKNFSVASTPVTGQFELSFNLSVPVDSIVTINPETYHEEVKVIYSTIEIRIYDFNGKPVYIKRTRDENIRQIIQLGRMPKGIYYVVIKQSNGEYIEKIIFE